MARTDFIAENCVTKAMRGAAKALEVQSGRKGDQGGSEMERMGPKDQTVK